MLSEWPRDVLVVDNASGTGEGERLGREFGIAHLETTHNGGVASGYNAALGWAAGHGYSHILLLNNDTVVAHGWLVDELASAASPGVAAVGPTVRDEGGSTWSAGGRLSRWTTRSWHRRRPDRSEPYEVDWIDGSAMLVSIDAVRRIGGFSEDFFLYWEELDWCARARRAGYTVLVQPSATIEHARGASATTLQTRTWSLRNSLLFARRHAGRAQLSTTLVAWTLIRVPVYLARVASREGIRAAVRGVREAGGWNLRDAARHGWRVPADGPPLADPSGPA